eukprot:TRINITY_DN1406_c0_g2_i1.p1 TRINITY_DN1406_c0_g2~~TRINITY_DN1406_c0_g2_i1.p1  ORF type:complete len:245 (+),score=35.56 TRINITY_DN1406_c0_g2_i1:85-819(+)
MDMVGPCQDVFRLDEMAEHYGVDVCCVSWQTQEGGWTRVTNNQTIVSVEQMDASNLHKILFTRLAPTFYEDMAQINSISSDPLVAQHPKLRFYAEALLADEHGRLFGSVSIAHRAPKRCQDIDFPDAAWLKAVRDVALTLKPDDNSEFPLLLRSLQTSRVPHKTDSGRYLSGSFVPHKTCSSSGYPSLSMGLVPRKTDSCPLPAPRSGTAASASSSSTQSDIDCEYPLLATRNFTASSTNSWDM